MNILHHMQRFVPILLLIGMLAGTKMTGQSCFEVVTESIACTTATGAPGYTYTGDLLVMGEIGIAYVELTILAPANVTITPTTKTISPTVAPDDTVKNISFAVTGSGATSGAIVKILVRLANGSSRTSLGCTDTLTFVLPICNATCLTVVNEKVECAKEDEEGKYTYTFDAINGGVLPLSGAELYSSVISPANVTVTPDWREIQGGFYHGDTLHDVRMTFDGDGAVGGANVKLRLRVCNDGICCIDTVEIVLPQCAPVTCFDLVRQEISCGVEENTYDYTIALKNTSNFTAGALILYSQEATFETPQFALGSLKPDQIVTRSSTLSVPKEYQGKEIMVTALFLGADGDSCSGSFELSVPECAPRKCFGITDTTLSCVPTTNGSKAYELGFTMRNESGKPVRWINFASMTPNVVAGKGWTDLGKIIAPGESIAIEKGTIGGPGVQVGAKVTIGMSLAGSSPTDLICSDSFAVVLPECTSTPPPFEGCFGIEADSVQCITSKTAPPAFVWTFSVRNSSNRTLDSLKIVSIASDKNGAVYAAPKVFTFVPGIVPGEIVTLGTTLTGPGAVDGATLTIHPEGFFQGEDATCRSSHELSLVCEEKEEETGCLSIADGSCRSVPEDSNRIEWNFVLTNESGSPIDRLLMTPFASNVVVVGGGVVFDEPVLPGESEVVMATLAGGNSGQTIEVRIAMASASPTNVICVDTVQATLPQKTSSVAGGESVTGVRFRGIYPNPADDRAMLRFALERSAGSVTVAIVDASGREVATPVESRSMPAGEHLIVIDADRLPAGPYIVALKVDGVIEARAFNVMR